jgi:hypothetical protein
MNREIERMFYEECITRQTLRRTQEREVRQKEKLNRSIEDVRRRKEEIRTTKEKKHYNLYKIYKRCDNHKQFIYYTDPYILDQELMQRIEEEDRVEEEDRRRDKEEARWAMEDERAREEDRDNRNHRKRVAFQELGFHMRLLEILQTVHQDPRIQHALDYYHKDAVIEEMKQIYFYRKQL